MRRCRAAPTASRSPRRDYNWSDGFSPGQIIVTLVRGLDLKRSGAAPVTDVGRSLKRNQPIVVIDAKTGKRQLIWSELNMVASNPRKRTLLVHPGIGWREGHRYIVALRNLKRSNGSTIKAPRAFRSAVREPSRPHCETSSSGWPSPGCAAAGCTWPGTSRSRAAAG